MTTISSLEHSSRPASRYKVWPLRRPERGERPSVPVSLYLGLLSVGLALWPSHSLAAQQAGPAPTAAEPKNQVQQSLIPVATPTGIIHMSQSEYEAYIKSMRHLPVMSKDYVFGRNIPQPKTDKDGHIHFSGGAAAAARDQRK